MAHIVPQSEPRPISVVTESADGKFIVCVPIMLAVEVDPLDGFTREEACEVASDRLRDLDLEVTLEGIPLETAWFSSRYLNA